MTELSDIVNVQIDRQTETVDRASFGTPLFLIEITTVTERVKSYSNANAVLDDYNATDVAYLMAQAAFSQEIRPSRVMIGQKATAETYVEALDAIGDVDDGWYGLAVETITKADILLIAAWIEARTKIFAARSADADIITSAINDLASDLQVAEYNRTFVTYHAAGATSYPDAAWLGNCLVRDPGSQTWMFKTLNSITPDTLTSSETDYALGKNCNVYVRIAGVNITQEGKMAGGEYIDVMRGIDWLTARIQERVFTRLINAPKISFTNAGIAVIETAVREQLDIALDQDLIAPEPAYTVTVPDVLDTDELDRQNRQLKGVEFRARLAGAIHYAEIRGTVYA